MSTLALLLTLVLAPSAAPADWRTAPPGEWQELFNGKNLDGWVVKLAHQELGDNYHEFGGRFGHLFYKQKLSHYVVSVEYRFFGEQAKGGPSYARLNSGVMVHSQAPETILKDQDWPISIEAQLLAGGR